ncbi:MAG: bifunctional 5,10-methylenetetrahydrofolate dehydrogenase/5,10-methenyltetrahydrofolate cyclohydrolase [Candidatus Sumerlaeia bacterium]|nr:bifunctional 5,10-methylenetetrahydrofolate dehydrogenase/5,10-methenyltetrahydrofolate cyclohydrolase [Candidatus Sumerlaeia bacterium]
MADGARLIDGKATAAAVRAELAAEIAKLPRKPGLGVVLVGDNPASHAYVRGKTSACAEVGIHAPLVQLPADATQAQALAAVAAFNADPAIDGVLVQLPLPRHLDEDAVVQSISPEKDVDGLHAANAGLLALGSPRFVPCTPLGCRELLLREGIETRGRHAVVVGRSALVGRPLATLLSLKGPGGDAAVTVVHSAVPDLAEHTRRADILVVAIGRPRFVTADMVKPGALVLDVGINRIDDASAAKGSRLVGDVDFDAVRAVAGAITPVPGGVGPMTVAMLLSNTVAGCRRRAGG